jgi:hypothetical protein
MEIEYEGINRYIWIWNGYVNAMIKDMYLVCKCNDKR